MIQAIYTFCIHALLILTLLSHTLFSSYLLQTITFLFVLILWIHHMYSYTFGEQPSYDEECILEPLLHIVHTQPTSDVRKASLITLSTSAVFFLGLEWISKTLDKLKQASLTLPTYASCLLPGEKCKICRP